MNGEKRMRKNLISVIIPVYKVEEYLDQCVRSVTEQSCRELEIILVDDGSPDRCPQLCDAWAERDPRVRVIHQQNRGLSGARNAGMDAARGEFIAFADSDDYLHPEMLQTLLKEMEDPAVSIVECGFHEICGSRDTVVSPKRTLLEKEEAVRSLLLPFGSVKSMVWNKLYRHDAVRGLRFPEQIRYGEDTPFHYAAIKAPGRYLQIPFAGYYYIRREDSLRGVPFRKEKMHTLRAAQLVEKDIREAYPAICGEAAHLVSLNAYALMRRMFEAPG